MNTTDPASSPATDAVARRLVAAGQGVLAAAWTAPAHVGLLTTIRTDGRMPGMTATGPMDGRMPGMTATRPMDGDVATRRDAISRRLQPTLPSAPVWLVQVHGASVAVLDATTLPSARATPPVADAVVTRLAGVVCAVLTADCLPVALTDRNGAAIGLAHAGWRGLSAGVLEATVHAMADQGIDAGDLSAWFGPAIGPASFEVGSDVMSAFCDRDRGAIACFVPQREGKWLADLYGLARRRLAAAGVREIHGGGLCTYADAQRFPSFRRDRTTERMATLMWLADGPGGPKL